MNTLIIGGNSRIAGHLAERLRNDKHEVTRTSRRSMLPVDDWSWIHLDFLIKAELPMGEWDSIFILAAITGFAACEKEPGVSWLVNADAPSLLAWQASRTSFQPHVVFTSSDAVEFASNTAYGRQKAYAECNVLAAGGCVARLGFVGDKVEDCVSFLVGQCNSPGLYRWS